MKVSVIGCGYLGAVHAAAMAQIGHEVIGIDTDAGKTEQLAAGNAPFFEPGLPELLRSGVEGGRLRFSTEMRDVADAEFHFLALGTPQRQGSHAADLSYLESAVEALLPYLHAGSIVVGKSTVPLGTAEDLAATIAPTGARLCWNPEFLREGWAVKDTLEPDRIVVGVETDEFGEPTASGTEVAERLAALYRGVLRDECPYLVTDLATAQLVKVAANAFLATKISFINAMAEIAEVADADVRMLADALGLDERIGRRFLGAGIGFGGGCLPKDIRAFSARAEELGRTESVAFLREVDAINQRRRLRAVELVVNALGGSVHQRRVTVLGASFKPFSDDIRDSPALEVATRLRGLGAKVTVTDPAALDNVRRMHPQLKLVADRDKALSGAEAVVLVTEWDEYRRELDPEYAASLVAQPVIIDGRNCLDAHTWRAAGWTYYGMGRR